MEILSHHPNNPNAVPLGYVDESLYVTTCPVTGQTIEPRDYRIDDDLTVTPLYDPLEMPIGCLCCGFDTMVVVEYESDGFYGVDVLSVEDDCPECGGLLLVGRAA